MERRGRSARRFGLVGAIAILAAGAVDVSGSTAAPHRGTRTAPHRTSASPHRTSASPHRRSSTTPSPGQATVTVGGVTRAPAIPKSFLGFSIEYQSAAVDAGPAADPNPLLDKLIETLNPGQRPVIRIGGDSTDHTWYPVAGHGNAGLSYALTPAWIASVATLAHTVDAQLILGIDLEMNNARLAAAEATALQRGIGATNILAWEVGNEPSLYGSFPWYTRIANDAASRVFTRPRSYGFSQYVDEFKATAAALPKLPLAGPALGTSKWMNQVSTLLAADPGIAQVTYHAYPLNCFATAGNPAYPSIANLLSPAASDGLANTLTRYVAAADGAHRVFRVDELNSDACGGAGGISNTFASALWATDTLFAMAAKGVGGVNIQTYNASHYRPFSFRSVHGQWTAQVAPLYYGLLLFSRAAPAGSRLLATTNLGGAPTLRAWAAQTPGTSAKTSGPETVTLINDSTTRAETVTVHAPGTSGGTLTRLLAPSATATSGETIAGLSYGTSTSTGDLTGANTFQAITPISSGTYRLTLAPASAALLSLTPS